MSLIFSPLCITIQRRRIWSCQKDNYICIKTIHEMDIARVFTLCMVLIIMPILLGGFIYSFNRQVPPLFLSVLDIHQSKRIPVSPWAHNLPDFLWLFALLNALGIIWSGNFRMYFRWTIAAFLGALYTEFAQKIQLISGTYDIWDTYSYIIAFILSLFIFHRLSNTHIPIHHV